MTSSARAAVCGVCVWTRVERRPAGGALRRPSGRPIPPARERRRTAGRQSSSCCRCCCRCCCKCGRGEGAIREAHRSRGTRAGTQPRSLGPPRRRTGPGDRHRPSGTAEAGRGGEARAGHALSDVLRGKDSLRHRRDLHEALGLPCLLFHVRCMDLRLRRSRVVRGTPSTEHRHRRLSASCRLRPAPCCPVSRLGASPARLP